MNGFLGLNRILALFGVLADPGLVTPVASRSRNMPAVVDGRGILWTRSADSQLPVPGAGSIGAPTAAFDTPAAATAPVAVIPASAGGLRNQLNTLVVTLNAVAAQGVLTVVVRDGATGVGAILWSVIIGPLGAANSQILSISGLNITGTAGSEMTIETTANPAATNFASIAATGIEAL